jgi:hypothetical protein
MLESIFRDWSGPKAEEFIKGWSGPEAGDD